MVEVRLKSPRITHFAWGVVEVEGVGAFKDVKLYPGGARGWDWNETGTRHVPGIQPGDVQELIDQGAEVAVLSKGVQERLGVTDAALTTLREADITVHILQTEQAIGLYNLLVEQGQRVGALIHSTC
jgi:hypothetical protein